MKLYCFPLEPILLCTSLGIFLSLPRMTHSWNSLPFPLFSPPWKGGSNNARSKSATVRQFVQQARSLGPIGKDLSLEKQTDLLKKAKALGPSPKAPAKIPLQGTHNLVYSASPGASSGKVGPFVGKVTQYFENDTVFYNRVDVGPLRIALKAERQAINDTTIRVTFQESIVSLLGIPLACKEISGGGVWQYLYAGVVTDERTGQDTLVRVMTTPSLFVLECPIPEKM